MTKETAELLRKFEIATSRAWIVDCRQYSSDEVLKDAWEKQKSAREAFIKHIEDLERKIFAD